MNKTQEIARLRAFVKDLTKSETYTGAWFEEQLPFIESAITSDTFPSERAMTFRGAQERAKQINAIAAMDAEAIVRKASREAEALKEEARQYAMNIKEEAAAALRSCLRKLDF